MIIAAADPGGRAQGAASEVTARGAECGAKNEVRARALHESLSSPQEEHGCAAEGVEALRLGGRLGFRVNVSPRL